MGHKDRLYGAFYGTTVMSKLWQEYAAADRRWGGSDLTVISLELLTVGVMGPLAFYVFTLLARAKYRQAWFWACVIATGEIYGGRLNRLCIDKSLGDCILIITYRLDDFLPRMAIRLA